jgi:hypothetical protein
MPLTKTSAGRLKKPPKVLAGRYPLKSCARETSGAENLRQGDPAGERPFTSLTGAHVVYKLARSREKNSTERGE